MITIFDLQPKKHRSKQLTKLHGVSFYWLMSMSTTFIWS
jgi:hypothetical protein